MTCSFYGIIINFVFPIRNDRWLIIQHKEDRNMFKNLQAEMVRSGIDNKKIAEILGVTIQTVRRKLSGEINISISEAKIIQKLFNNPSFTIDFLFA